MTWNELNERTDDNMPDMLGYSWYELVDDGADDDKIYKCQALEMVIEVLKEQDETDYKLINELELVR